MSRMKESAYHTLSARAEALERENKQLRHNQASVDCAIRLALDENDRLRTEIKTLKERLAAYA